MVIREGISRSDSNQPGVDEILVKHVKGLPLDPLLEVVVNLLLTSSKPSAAGILKNNAEALFNTDLKDERRTLREKNNFNNKVDGSDRIGSDQT
jgi:hypothetical protein